MHGFCIDIYTWLFIPYHLYLTIYALPFISYHLYLTIYILPFIPYHLRMCSRHTDYRSHFPNSCSFLYIVLRTHRLRMGINNLLQKIRCTLWEQNIFWEEKIHVIPSCIFQKHLQESLVKTKQTSLFSHCVFIYLYIFQLCFYIQSSMLELYYNWIMKCCYIYAS